jgi:hypothetical protein
MSRALQLLNARQWLGAKVLSTVIFAIVVFVWLPAPIGAGESEGGGWDLAERLLLVLAIMAMLVPLLTGRGPQGTDGWQILATRLVVGALGIGGLYTYEAVKWSCPYAGEHVVIGTTLTDDVGRPYVVKKYGPADIEQHATDACKDIIWEHAGDVAAIWTRSSIDARRSWLKWLYVLAAALWGCAITAVEHAVTLKRTSRVDIEKWREELQVLSEALPETIDLPIFISYRRHETGLCERIPRHTKSRPRGGFQEDDRGTHCGLRRADRRHRSEMDRHDDGVRYAPSRRSPGSGSPRNHRWTPRKGPDHSAIARHRQDAGGSAPSRTAAAAHGYQRRETAQ